MYDAFKKQGLEFGVYYSHNFDWKDGTDNRAFETITKNLYDGHTDKAISANIWDPFPNTWEESLLNKTFPKMNLLRVEKKIVASGGLAGVHLAAACFITQLEQNSCKGLAENPCFCREFDRNLPKNIQY